MARKKYDQSMIDEVHRDKRFGFSLQKIGNKHGLSMNQVSYIVYELTPTPIPPTPRTTIKLPVKEAPKSWFSRLFGFSS
jgi:hypothetical protein|tara:strand:- start:228 stop:464 length:237 start_codon:yes stop_codon:yes gene_type:complete